MDLGLYSDIKKCYIHFIFSKLNRLLLTKKLLAVSWKNFPQTVTHFLCKTLQDDSN